MGMAQLCICSTIKKVPIANSNEELYVVNNDSPKDIKLANESNLINAQQPTINSNQLMNNTKKKKLSSIEPEVNTNTKDSTLCYSKYMNDTAVGINKKQMRYLCWNTKATSMNNTVEYYLNNLCKGQSDTSSWANLPEIAAKPNETLQQNLDETNTEHKPFLVLECQIPVNILEKVNKLIEEQFNSCNISLDILSNLSNEMIYISLPKDKIIYSESDNSNFLYIISQGSVSLQEISKNKMKEKKNAPKELKEWTIFGQLSLLEIKKRNEEVKCLDNVELYVVNSAFFRDLQKRNNEAILKERFNFLNTIFIFECLDKISKYNVAQKLTKKEFSRGDKIIQKDEIGDSLYIIKEGAVSCQINGEEVRQLYKGDYFGENAVLVDIKRSADIVALEKCICYELSREDLKDALSDEYIDVILFCFFKNSIENNEYLKSVLIESLLHEIFICFNVKIYSHNEKLYNSKSKDLLKSNSKKLVIVIEGSLKKDQQVVAEKGKILGEEMFKDYNKSIPDDIVAFPDCITLEAAVADLAKIMKIDLDHEKQLKVLKYINKLKKLYLFKNLSEKTLESIAANMKKQKFKPNEVIVQEGTIGDKFYLISKGKIKITKEGKFIRALESGSCLGENSLLTDNAYRTASATAVDKVLCYVISKNDFNLILTDKTTKDFLLKKLALQDTSINLSDLNYIKFLGKGKFGSVSLVHNGRNIYAIKAISRKSVDRENILAKYFVNERRIMLSLDHPFIVKMVKSLKNKYYCFLLIEYVNGMNLDDFLNKRGCKRNIEETRFYIASLLLMVDYLQKKLIVHRDIKPANIMIDSNGYLKMIDFGTAKVLTDYTSTIIGTPHYIAPEILQGKGYSMSCDYWSIGICLYEMFYGCYPFGNFANEVIEIYKEILSKDFNFPSESSKYSNVNNLIRDLLRKRVNQRICNFSMLKKRPFFEGFDFDKLNDFKLKPAYKPKSQDFSSFLKEKRPYEQILQEDNSVISKRPKETDYSNGYNPNWADEF